MNELIYCVRKGGRISVIGAYAGAYHWGLPTTAPAALSHAPGDGVPCCAACCSGRVAGGPACPHTACMSALPTSGGCPPRRPAATTAAARPPPNPPPTPHPPSYPTPDLGENRLLQSFQHWRGELKQHSAAYVAA